MRARQRIRETGSVLALGVMLAISGGCNDAVSGGATGAALGALAGMGLGSLSGDMGKGAAAGAIIGGIGGAVLGDQNQRADNRARGYGGSYHRGHGYPD